MLTMKLTPMIMQQHSSIKDAISASITCNNQLNDLSRDLYNGMIVTSVFWSKTQLEFLAETGSLLITASRSGVQISLVRNEILRLNSDYDVTLIRKNGSHEIWKRGEIAESYIGAKVANIFFSESSVAYLYFYSRLPLRVCARLDEMCGDIALYWEESQ